MQGAESPVMDGAQFEFPLWVVFGHRWLYPAPMLRAALFRDFKGADTLLIWGATVDLQRAYEGLCDIQQGRCAAFDVEGGLGLTELSVRSSFGDGKSEIVGTIDAVTWSCSQDVLGDCLAVLDTLLTATVGHQYVDARGGLADQVMFSVSEYPDDYRRKV